MAVNDHDFRSQAEGMAIPYGLHDTQANRGFVVVGKDHDTAEFAVQGFRRPRNGSWRPVHSWLVGFPRLTASP
jgi:hypothetical protein